MHRVVGTLLILLNGLFWFLELSAAIAASEDSGPVLPTYHTVIQTCSKMPDRPQTLDELTGGYDVFYVRLSEDEAIKIGLLSIVEASQRRSKLVQVHMFVQYLTDTCEVQGVSIPIIWGVGVQATLHIKKGEKYLAGDRLPLLAAAVELNKASVTFALTTLGITGAAVRDTLPDAGAFNVENYAEMISAVDRIRRMLEDPTVTIVPQVIVPRSSFHLITQPDEL